MFAAFDPADIAPIQPRLVRQRLLRHSQLATARPNALAENVEIGVAHPSN